MLWRFVSILNPCVNKCSNHTLYWQDTEIKIATRCNNWGTQSPTYPISWTIMLPQNKIRRNHEGCFFMKKTGSMPCTGTETTTITNTMLNTLKLRRVMGLKLRTNATFQSATKKVLPKFEENETLPPLPIFLLSSLFASCAQIFLVGPHSRPKHSYRSTDTFWLWGEGAVI